MGMTKCKECSAEISTEAESCPHCGAKTPKKTSFGTWLVLILFVVMIVSWPDSDSPSSSASTPAKPVLTAEQKKAKKTALLKKLKTIPASEIYTNRDRYNDLLELDPKNKAYTKKHAYYTSKVTKLEKKIGKYPSVSGYDGVPYAVKSYVKRVAKDPDSIDYDRCGSITYNNSGWNVTCRFRANNSFGAKVLEQWAFVIRHDTVISAKD